MQFGAAMILLWLANWLWILYEVYKYTPNWHDKDVDSDEIAQNFMTNAPPEKIEKMSKIADMNPIIGMSGVALLLLATII
jgi:hypothetical protein